MSNYTKSTNFATKDNLSPGDPLKIVRGTEIDTEFNNIATAIATKTDNSSAAITGGSISGITDLAIADGGTGASTATDALNNLLPSQTGNATKYLQTDGSNATWDAVSLSTSDITGTLPVANGGTGVTSSTGTGSTVLSNSPTLVTPTLGTPASATLTNATGLPISTGVSGLGTGVATFLATPSSANLASAVSDETGSGALVFANSPTLVTPALGTPSSATLTNATGLPISTGVSGLGTGVATALAVNVGSAGAPVVNGGALGTPSSGIVTNLTGTASININGTVGATTPTTGAFTTTTVSTSETLSYGTANGVTYLNGSKVLTSGSALTFDGTNLAVSTGKVTTSTAGTSAGFQWGGTTVTSRLYDDGGGTVYLDVGVTGSNSTVPLVIRTKGGSVAFNNGSSEILNLSSTGNLGLGVTPSAWNTSVFKALQINAQGALMATSASMQMGNNVFYDGAYKFIGTGYANRYYQASGQHVWTVSTASGTAGGAITETQAMTLDASGRLIVGGTSVPDNGLSTYVTNGTVGIGNYLSTTVGYIGTWTNHPFAFATNGTERARIDSSGNLLVGTTTSSVTSGNGIKLIPGTASACNIVGSADTNANFAHTVYSTSPAAYRFQVGWGGTIYATSTSISAISDQTLKTNVRDLETGITEVMALKPRRFDWINGDATDVAGFIAQEVEQVLPELVDDYLYSHDEDGNNIIKKSLKMGDILPTLVKAIQEQQAIITTLTERITALEAK